MTVPSGLKSFCFALCLSAVAIAYSGAYAADKELTPEVKKQLATAMAGAKPVALNTSVAVKPVAPSASSLKNIDAVDEKDLQDLEPIPPTVNDAEEIEPLRIGLDKPEIVRLDRDAVNVIVGSDENLRVVPDTNKNLVLIAKKPGSTYFRALDVDGKVIMQRHVIIGSPSKNYIRIRRACANGASGCKQYSVYYCPDMCHEVSVVQDASTGGPAAVPVETPVGSAQKTGKNSDGASETPHTSEPPPGE